MPRPKLIRTTAWPYHLRSRANNKEWFYVPTQQLWQVFGDVIGKTVESYGLAVHLFVLMSNHFHMIASTPNANLGEAMQYLIREVSKEVGRLSGRINRVFGARYQRSVIDSELYMRNAFKYVCRNPIAAGLSDTVESYPYSTLPWLIGKGEPIFPIASEPSWIFGQLFTHTASTLEWLNSSYHPEQAELVRRGLRRQRCRWSSNSRFRSWVDKM